MITIQTSHGIFVVKPSNDLPGMFYTSLLDGARVNSSTRLTRGGMVSNSSVLIHDLNSDNCNYFHSLEEIEEIFNQPKNGKRRPIPLF